MNIYQKQTTNQKPINLILKKHNKVYKFGFVVDDIIRFYFKKNKENKTINKALVYANNMYIDIDTKQLATDDNGQHFVWSYYNSYTIEIKDDKVLKHLNQDIYYLYHLTNKKT